MGVKNGGNLKTFVWQVRATVAAALLAHVATSVYGTLTNGKSLGYALLRVGVSIDVLLLLIAFVLVWKLNRLGSLLAAIVESLVVMGGVLWLTMGMPRPNMVIGYVLVAAILATLLWRQVLVWNRVFRE